MNRPLLWLLGAIGLLGLLLWGESLQPGRVVPAGPPDQPRTFQGSGSLKTEAFPLRGGSYRVQWDAVPIGTYLDSCPYSVRLGRVDSARPLDVLVLTTAPRAPAAAGSSAAHGVGAGTYYLDIVSACDWHVTLAPEQ